MQVGAAQASAVWLLPLTARCTSEQCTTHRAYMTVQDTVQLCFLPPSQSSTQWEPNSRAAEQRAAAAAAGHQHCCFPTAPYPLLPYLLCPTPTVARFSASSHAAGSESPRLTGHFLPLSFRTDSTGA